MTPLIDAPQGSSAWHAARAKHFCASEAAAAVSLSKYTTRDELMRQKATGLIEQVSPAKQRLFDSGHDAEAKARPIAEGIAGTEFYPVVATHEVEGMQLLASFDGIDLLDEVIWENKLLNQSLVQQVQAGDLEPHYYLQLEHQLLVSGAQRALFTTSDGTPDGTYSLWYESKPERRAELIAGWKQFAVDLAAYVAPDAAPQKVVAESVTTLPVVSCHVSGDLAVKHSLPAFEIAWKDFLANKLVREPETDQDFANLEQQVKAMEAAEAQLDAAEESALSETEVLSQFIVLKRALRDMVCEQRKASKKQLTEKKESIKLAQVQRGQKAFAEHMASLNARLGKPYMPAVPADFNGVIKGKRTVDSLRGAVNDELARAKIAANEIADRIQLNLNTLREQATAHAFLFADAPTLVMKANDDLQVLIKSRISEHEAKEAKRLEDERARIRAEEQARADREAREKLLQDERDAQAAIAQAKAAEQLAAPLADDLSNLAREKTQEAVAGIDAGQAISQAQRAAAAGPAVVPLRAAPAPTTQPTLKLGAIAERLGFNLTADFLRSLGFEPAGKQGAHGVYHEAQFPQMLAALVRHIEGVQAKAAA